MKTKISLPEGDTCELCENECPNNIYDCEKLTIAINTKIDYYGWRWMPKKEG